MLVVLEPDPERSRLERARRRASRRGLRVWRLRSGSYLVGEGDRVVLRDGSIDDVERVVAMWRR